MKFTVKVLDYTKFPGPRFKKLGGNSGEWFREDVLIPAIEEHNEVIVDLDGTIGYGSSFLDEAFAGLLRHNVDACTVDFIAENIISNDLPDIKDEIQEYINDEKTRQGIECLKNQVLHG